MGACSSEGVDKEGSNLGTSLYEAGAFARLESGEPNELPGKGDGSVPLRLSDTRTADEGDVDAEFDEVIRNILGYSERYPIDSVAYDTRAFTESRNFF